MRKKTVSLVLSSGGARGMAHIGVIEAVEEAGYEIISIAGSSAGASGSAPCSWAGSLMAISSRSNTNTELAGISGLGLWAP